MRTVLGFIPNKSELSLRSNFDPEFSKKEDLNPDVSLFALFSLDAMKELVLEGGLVASSGLLKPLLGGLLSRNPYCDCVIGSMGFLRGVDDFPIITSSSSSLLLKDELFNAFILFTSVGLVKSGRSKPVVDLGLCGIVGFCIFLTG